MRAPENKYRRLMEATEKFNSFHRFVDFLTIVLFLAISVAIANKLLPNKLVDLQYFQWSWKAIIIASGIFVFMFVCQTYYERGHFLSSFQKEAALKAARKNNFRRPYRW